MTTLSKRRVQAEFNTLEKECFKIDNQNNIQKSRDSDIQQQFDKKDLENCQILIVGPEETCYELGQQIQHLNFTDEYPNKPPRGKFLSTDGKLRLHPNMQNNGKLCLSILGTWTGPEWRASINIEQIAFTISSLLDNDPLRNEPGQVDRNADDKHMQEYKHFVEYASLLQTVTKMHKEERVNQFQDLMLYLTKENQKTILKLVNKRKENIKKLFPQSANTTYQIKNVQGNETDLDQDKLIDQLQLTYEICKQKEFTTDFKLIDSKITFEQVQESNVKNFINLDEISKMETEKMGEDGEEDCDEWGEDDEHEEDN